MRVASMPKAYNFSNFPVNNFRFLTADNVGYKVAAMTMGDRIKERMDEIGMSQETLAKAVGISQPAIFKILAGKTKRTTRLSEIAAVLGVRPGWLVTGEGSKLELISAEDREILEELKTMDKEEKDAYRVILRNRRKDRIIVIEQPQIPASNRQTDARRIA